MNISESRLLRADEIDFVAGAGGSHGSTVIAGNILTAAGNFNGTLQSNAAGVGGGLNVSPITTAVQANANTTVQTAVATNIGTAEVGVF